MSKQILVKPLITEKSEQLSEGQGQFSFEVHKKANKIEIRKAVETMYGVRVTSVNTLIMPAKFKQRTTRAGVTRGKKKSYKKAIVTLQEGDSIDIYGEV